MGKPVAKTRETLTLNERLRLFKAVQKVLGPGWTVRLCWPEASIPRSAYRDILQVKPDRVMQRFLKAWRKQRRAKP